MPKQLTQNDIDDIKRRAGHDGPVTLSRDEFEALLADYRPRFIRSALYSRTPDFGSLPEDRN